MLSGWGLYRIYHVLNLHFTSASYDIIRYNGKTKQNLSHYVGRKDETRFVFLASKFSSKKVAGQWCIANFVYNDPGWIWQSFEQSMETYDKWKIIKERLPYEFEQQLKIIIEITRKHGIEFNDIFKMTGKGKHPPLWQMIAAKLINYETCVILNNEINNFCTDWSPLCDLDPLLDDTIFKIKKYATFVSYDKAKISNVIKELLQ